jgi:hypothetical protein
VEGSDRGLILRYYPGTCLEGLRKTAKNLGQDIRSPDRDLKPEPPEYETGELTSQQRRSVTPIEGLTTRVWAFSTSIG